MKTATITPAPPRKRRKLRQDDAPAQTTLTLVAATYAPSISLTLTFDRAVDVSGIVGGAITVDDGEDGRLIYVATGAVAVLSPTSVRIGLVPGADSEREGVTLDATAGNGIVSLDDSVAWAGASELELPFP